MTFSQRAEPPAGDNPLLSRSSPAGRVCLLAELTAEEVRSDMGRGASDYALGGSKGRLWAYVHCLLILSGEKPSGVRIGEVMQRFVAAARERVADG